MTQTVRQNDLARPWLRCPDYFGGECTNPEHSTLTPNFVGFFRGCLERDYATVCPRLAKILEKGGER